MTGIQFPKMFNTNSTKVWLSSDHLAITKQNAVVLLQCNRNELFGDPYFGTLFRQYMYDQNSYKIKDVIIDMLYTQLALFLPQLRIDRKDIDIIQDKEKGKIYCTFSAVNQIDFQLNTYQLVVFSESTI